MKFACRSVALALVACTIAAGPLSGQTISFFLAFNTPGIEEAAGVATDPTGVYVIGNKTGERSAGIRKYDFNGKELWTREFRGTGAQDRTLLGVAADATGIFVLGSTRDNARGGVVRRRSVRISRRTFAGECEGASECTPRRRDGFCAYN